MIGIEPTRGDDPRLRALLEAADLPTDDLKDAGRMFFLVRSDGATIGCGGLEVTGGDVLLRSIAIDPRHRGRGLGRKIARDVLERARLGGAVRAYLLTTSAASFFETIGFARIDRADAPDAVLRTRQASSICPASAVVMVKDLAS